MVATRFRRALAASLLAPAPAYTASGQLVPARRDEASTRTVQQLDTTSEDAFLVFDFDRDMLFHDRVAGSAPITAIKKFFITWKSDDGTRAGVPPGVFWTQDAVTRPP